MCHGGFSQRAIDRHLMMLSEADDMIRHCLVLSGHRRGDRWVLLRTAGQLVSVFI